jgi:hypothetical protein
LPQVIVGHAFLVEKSQDGGGIEPIRQIRTEASAENRRGVAEHHGRPVSI